MTGLHRWRRGARSLIKVSMAWEAGVAIAGLVVFLIVVVQGGEDAGAERLITGVGSLALLGVVIGAVWDSRRRQRRRQQG